MTNPAGVVTNSAGDIFIADTAKHRVLKVTAAGSTALFAGSGVGGYSGDGGAATSAKLASPRGLALDTAGNLYIADTGNNRIRKVTAAGVISTVVGTGVAGDSGDGAAATAAKLNSPRGVAVAPAGLLIADTGNNRVRRVAYGVIVAFAGTGVAGSSGDGAAATAAQLNAPRDVIQLGTNFLIADTGNHRVRRVAYNGSIFAFAGTGTAGYSGNGVAATSAQLNTPSGLGVASDSSLLIADTANHRIRKVTTAGTIWNAAGNGTAGNSGYGGHPLLVPLNSPEAVTSGPNGFMGIADTANSRIRAVGNTVPFATTTTTSTATTTTSASTTTTSSSTTTTASTTSTTLPGCHNSTEYEAFQLANNERTAAGFTPLVASCAIHSAAVSHSEAMVAANLMAHQVPGEQPLCDADPNTLDRYQVAQYTWSLCAENVGAGTPTFSPSGVVSAWMASTGHRSLILCPNMVDGAAALSHLASPSTDYWTLDFGRTFSAPPNTTDKPGSPYASAPTGGTGTATINWLPTQRFPICQGGSAVTQFLIARTSGPSSPAPQTVTNNNSSTQAVTFTGLTAGTYTFTVKAINSAGTGPASQPITVTVT